MRNILISGAGTGIGQAIAIRLSMEGWKIILLGRHENTLKKTLSKLKNPQSHFLALADTRDRHSIHKALGFFQAKSLQAVVANAGIGGENQYGEDDRWQDIIDTNLTGTYYLVNEALPLLKKDKGKFKNIVVISSILARLGVPKYSAYCASKAGLLGLIRSWAAELSVENILVNAICPGWVNTDMATQGLQSFAAASGKTFETIHAEQMDSVPLGKMSAPEEIANLVAYLIDPIQKSITGQSFDINNGAIMPC